MAKFLFFMLCGLSGLAIALGLRRRDGILQFPTLFSAAFAFSTVPQLVNHVFYTGRLPFPVYSAHGVEFGILMCILCLLAGIVGYYTGRPLRLETLFPEVTFRRVFAVGVIMCLTGLYGASMVSELAGGFKARFTEGGHYALEWSGSPVLWTYIGKLLWLGLPLCLMATLKKGSFFRWAFTLAMFTYPMMTILFLGRRTGTFAVAATVAFCLFFQKRWVPPRSLALLALIGAGLLIIFLPSYRGHANRTGDISGAIAQVDPEEAIEGYLRGERGEGIDNLIVGIPARSKHFSFGLGSGFWNGMVDFFVPAQIVGRSVKDGLMVKFGGSDAEIFMDFCGYSPDFDAFTTGPYSVYKEFWFFGCLIFYGIARFYRTLWSLAVERRLLSAQLIYTATAMCIPMSVINSVPDTLPMFTLAAGAIGLGLWFVRISKSARAKDGKSITKARPSRKPLVRSKPAAGKGPALGC